MMPDELLLGVLRELLAKSRKNQVLWIQSDVEVDCFELHLTMEMHIYISYRSPPAASDRICVGVLTEKGEPISLTQEDGEPNYPFLLDLYCEACRRATGWHEVLEKINSIIQGEGIIGINPSDSYTH